MTSKEIGLRISTIREECGLTRKELSEKIHVAASTITRYERGEIINVKLPVLTAIANALSINPLWLTGKSKYKNVSDMKNSWGDSFVITDSEKEMIKKYRQLSPAGKSAVDMFLDAQYDFVKPKLLENTETS